MVASIVVFLNFLQVALRNATFRYTTFEIGRENEERLNQVFSMAVNSHFLLGLLVVVLLEIAGVWFLNTRLNIPQERLIAANWVFQFSLVTVFITIVRTPYESLILSYERMDFYALLSIIEVFLKLGIVFLLNIILVDKLILYSCLIAVIAIVLSLGYFIYCRIVFYNCRYHMYWDSGLLKEFSRYSGWSILVNGACMARSQCITIFFNIFLGVVANAALGIANQVIGALNMFVTNFTQAFNPQIVKSWATKEYRYFFKIIFLSSKISYFLLLIVCIPVVINIDFILGLWLGDYPVMTAVYIESILLYFLVDAMQSPLVNAVHATGNLKLHQISIAGIVFLYIPISYIMLCCGCAGDVVLIVNAIINVVCAVVRIYIMKKLINLNLEDYLKGVIIPILGVTIFSIPIPVVAYSLFAVSLKSFFITSVLSVLLTSICCFFIGLNHSERLTIKKYISTKIK